MVPPPGPRYNEPSWFTGSRTPGELGSAVLLGHVDSAADGPSVFFRLGALHPGDKISVTRADHRVALFAVNAVREYSKTQFPLATVFGATDHAALRLITCGGSFDSAAGSYRSNIVVFAHLVSSQP
jgi:sortase (surface protein transpeptidase)